MLSFARSVEAIDALVNQRQKMLVVSTHGFGVKARLILLATKFSAIGAWVPRLLFSPLLALMRNKIESAKAFRYCLQKL